MGRHLQTVKGAVLALGRFAGAYPGMCAVASLIYAGCAVLSARYLPSAQVYGQAGSHLAVWAATLPQTIMLAPIWTALLRFMVLREEGRRYLAWDYRVRRVFLVTFVLSAILMAGGLPLALSFDLMPRFALGRPLAAGAMGTMLGVKIVSWWFVMRLAIAPTLAAAGRRSYPLDTAFTFTRHWIGTIFGVKFVIYAPLVLLTGSLLLAGRLRPDLSALLPARPLPVATVTLATALAEVTDVAAMALVALRIVRVRSGGNEDEAMA